MFECLEPDAASARPVRPPPRVICRESIDFQAVTLSSRKSLLRRAVRLGVLTGGKGGAVLNVGPERRWDVALSFAGAQRDYVEQVASGVEAGRCFYDADERMELWRKYLAEELPAIYGEQGVTVVMFVSAEYAARE